MLISLSKKTDNEPRRAVLVAEEKEMGTVTPVVHSVLRGRRPVRKYRRATRQWLYYFNADFLDDLLLAFPIATKSAGLQRRLDRLNSRAMAVREVDPFPIPGLWDYKYDRAIYPFDYQYTAIAEIVRFLSGQQDGQLADDVKIEHFLENDEMGLGKTFMVLSALLMLKHIPDTPFREHPKVLVISPKNGKFVWERENDRWSRFDLQVVDADQHRPEQRPGLIKRRADITVINPEMLRGQIVTKKDRERPWVEDITFVPKYPDLFNFEYDVVVMDEYHRFGSPVSQQSYGMLQLQAKKFLPLSGTPFLTRPTQLWPVLHRCWPERFPDYDMFKTAIEILDTDGSKKVVGYQPRFTRTVKEFMEPRSIRRRKDQVLAGLPEVLPVDIFVDLNREQRRIYNKIRDEAILMMEDGSFTTAAQQSVTLRLKQACFSPELFGGSKHSAKIDELLAYVESMVNSNEKAIIFSEWSKATRILQRELARWNPAYVDGSVSGRARMAEADRFNHDPECHLYVGTIGANREAVSLSAATTVIFTDKDHSPQVNAQAAGRSAGGGLRGLEADVPHISIVSMIGKDSYEERVEETLSFRLGTFNAVVEGDGGARVNKQVKTSLIDLM